MTVNSSATWAATFRLYTLGLGTPTTSQYNIFDSEKLSFSCAPDRIRTHENVSHTIRYPSYGGTQKTKTHTKKQWASAGDHTFHGIFLCRPTVFFPFGTLELASIGLGFLGRPTFAFFGDRALEAVFLSVFTITTADSGGKRQNFTYIFMYNYVYIYIYIQGC